MKDYSQYVVPILPPGDGNGFFVGNKFVTAGHCLNNGPISVFYKGKTLTFDKSDAIYFRNITDELESENVQDIAIFQCRNINSPLRFSRIMPEDEMVLNSISYDYISPEKSDSTSPFSNGAATDMRFDKKIVCAHYKKTLFHFFECFMWVPCRRGNSGSPLLYDNLVYGILSASVNDTLQDFEILFCSTTDIP